jgi:hypothetical protein
MFRSPIRSNEVAHAAFEATLKLADGPDRASCKRSIISEKNGFSEHRKVETFLISQFGVLFDDRDDRLERTRSGGRGTPRQMGCCVKLHILTPPARRGHDVLLSN